MADTAGLRKLANRDWRAQNVNRIMVLRLNAVHPVQHCTAQHSPTEHRAALSDYSFLRSRLSEQSSAADGMEIR